MKVSISLLPYVTKGISFLEVYMASLLGLWWKKADPQQVHQPYIVSETTFDKGVA